MSREQSCCSHAHDCDESSCATKSLNEYIDKDKLQCYNLTNDSRAKNVFRYWHERLEREPEGVRSDDEAEIMIRIPFTEDVKLTGIVIVGGGGEEGSSPSELRVFANDQRLDLENAQRKKPTQKFDLVEDFLGEVEYETDRTKFMSVSTVTLYVSKNFGSLRGEDRKTEISYIGLRGEASGNRRDMIVTAVYETRGIPKDHKVNGDDNLAARHAL